MGWRKGWVRWEVRAGKAGERWGGDHPSPGVETSMRIHGDGSGG